MIAFPKGAWYALDSVANLGYNVISMDWLHDPAEAVKTIGDRPVVLQGNADPGVLYGSHEAITKVVQGLVDGFGWAQRKKGWIVNLGHGKCFPRFRRLDHHANMRMQVSRLSSSQTTCASSLRKSTA